MVASIVFVGIDIQAPKVSNYSIVININCQHSRFRNSVEDGAKACEILDFCP